jgi:hypothetical protein
VTESLTQAFYSPPNEVDPSRLPGDVTDLLNRLRTRLESPGARTVLPARVGGVTRWYGLAPSQREARLLREDLRCWLGPPLAISQVEVATTATDPIDLAARQLVRAGAVIRVDIAAGWVMQARNNIELLTQVWALAPERGIDQPRPVGRVLRQFYESLLGDDRPLAQAALDELKARALLSATNLRFLRVELLSALGTPQELRDDLSLRGISLLARPPAVTERLAEAANALFIVPALANSGSGDWRDVAKQLDEAWPTLVTHSHHITTQATARCFALGQLLIETHDQPHLSQLAERFPDDPVIKAAVAVSGPPSAPAQPATVLGLYNDGAYDAALALAESEPPNRSTAAIALFAAINLADSAAAVRALAVVERLPGVEREDLLSTAVERSFYKALRARTSDAHVPADWLDWLNGDWPDRPDLLADWSRQWSRSSGDVEAMADPIAEALLDALNDSRRARVRNGIPVLVEWIIQDGIPPAGVALATTIFDILLSSEPGKTERQAALSLLDEVLAAGCTSQEYGELLRAIDTQLPIIGPRDSGWLAQSVDLLLISACPDALGRDALVARAAALAQSWVDRLDPHEVLVLGLLFRPAGLEFPMPAEAATGERKARRPFRSVGLYSLLENATRVVSAWIRARWEGVDVRISSGAVNSASLTALVKGVDVMLVQTSRAKHAATDAITAAIDDPTRLVLVHGRGATALMRALLEWSEGESTS